MYLIVTGRKSLQKSWDKKNSLDLTRVLYICNLNLLLHAYFYPKNIKIVTFLTPSFVQVYLFIILCMYDVCLFTFFFVKKTHFLANSLGGVFTQNIYEKAKESNVEKNNNKREIISLDWEGCCYCCCCCYKYVIWEIRGIFTFNKKINK